jgi:hypothetical protein
VLITGKSKALKCIRYAPILVELRYFTRYLCIMMTTKSKNYIYIYIHICILPKLYTYFQFRLILFFLTFFVFLASFFLTSFHLLLFLSFNRALMYL